MYTPSPGSYGGYGGVTLTSGGIWLQFLQLSHEYQHNYKGKCYVSVNKPIPGVSLYKDIPVGIEPTTETETLVFTLYFKANIYFITID